MDEGDYGELAERFWPWLWTVAKDIAPDALAEDYAQEGLIAIWQSIQKHGWPRQLDAWAKVIARRRMLSLRRNSQGPLGWYHNVELGDVPETAGLSTPADTHLITAIHGEEIRAAISHLADKQRRYVELRFWEELPFPEIKAELGGRTNSTWRRARERLAQELSHLEDTA